ncbi:hypothetical protein HJC23_013919 [Cyclotella cryptica]|uniref:Dolichol-phosphate mannosyltransferase subunit 3 n=1 Tax=Cyclotella cryptica TaxID=29204 RepID=A0ABD3QGD7_9STRA|eukprot:CCRYP_005530-RA/>CCRYP_005530-RA protein AED:0.37 eAED:0.37 QI:0/-1/0/1/-1/1/1/0/103
MASILRYQVFLSVIILFLSIWKNALANTVSLQRSLPFSPSTNEVIITYLPIWALIILGIYALASVLVRVATFEDCSEAAVQLGREIEEAKLRLKGRGFELLQG